MGMSNLTAMIISNRDDLIVSHSGPTNNGKFVGWITLGPDDYCRPLLNTNPDFESADAAEQHMINLIAKIRHQ